MGVKIKSPIFVNSEVTVLHRSRGCGWFNLDGPVWIISMDDIYDDKKRDEFREKLISLYDECSRPAILDNAVPLSEL